MKPIGKMQAKKFDYSGNPTISVADNTLVDDKLHIHVSGLGRNQSITIHARLSTENGQTFSSFGCYTANTHGVVDVESDVCKCGTYEGTLRYIEF